MEAEPIRDLADINAIHRILTKWGNVREAECFIIGSNFALRIGDLLKTTVSQTLSDKIIVKGNEQKTGKYKEFPINDSARKSIDRLLFWYHSQGIDPEYLFQGTGNRAKNLKKPISARYLNKKLQEAVNSLGLDVSVSTHTMRKNAGFHAYMNGASIRDLQALFNHSTERQCLNYIGVTKKTVSDVYLNSVIGIDIK